MRRLTATVTRTPRPASPDAGAPIRLQKATRARGAPSARRVTAWALAAGAPAAATLTVRLVGESESCRLNQQFRGKAGATNVLAFPAGEGAARAEPELGDLVICLPLVRREARAQGKRLQDHCAHLVVHGVLHLLGHDHDRAADARTMERAEKRILRRLGIGDPYRPAGGSGKGAGRRKAT